MTTDNSVTRRCQATNKDKQCARLCDDGFDYCSFHNSGQIIKLKKDETRNYLLTRWRAEVDHYANHSQVKSLREEIGILRLLMQTTLNKCLDENDLLIHTPRIMELTQRLERTIDTCNRLEEKTQFLVDKTQIIMLAEQILMIFSEFVPDTNILGKVAARIQEAIEAKASVVTIEDGKVVDRTENGTFAQPRTL